jgi:hypothetical protein
MTVERRDYFAANAPAVPQWFEHEPVGKRPERPKPSNFPPAPGESRDTWESRARNALNQHTVDCELWRQANEHARYFQWRRFYADKMLEILGGN